MFARITKITDLGADVDRSVQTVRDEVIPRVKDLDGYQGFVGFVDRDAGTFMSFTLWESEEAMRASEQAANQLRSGVAKQFTTQEPTVKRFETVILEVPSALSV
jgi:heme-degrading monooxygenase HmoA